MPHFPDAASQDSEGDKMSRVTTKNRRHRYLELHPSYFSDANLELADPLLYYRLVRRFQSATEREQEGREKGYSRGLEASILRGEAEMDSLRNPDANNPVVYERAGDGSISALEADAGNRVNTKEEGRRRWEDLMRQRFLRGEDDDFDYATVDENDEYDDRSEEDRKALQRYLDDEEAEFLGEGRPEGETGVQDF